MKLKTIPLIIGCISLSIVVVLTLHAISDHHIRRNNSFLRIVLKHPTKYIGGMNLPYNSYYIAGVTENKIYLGNYTGILHLLVGNPQLTDTQHVKLSIRNIGQRKFHTPRLTVRPPYFYITDGTVPFLLRGSVDDWQADDFTHDKSAYFHDAVPIGHSSFAFRATKKDSPESILGKLSPDTPYVNLAPTILEKQVDGKFCTDGKLLYDNDLKRIVYVYLYRNQYIVMDSSMNLVFRGKTIDTVSHAQIRVSMIGSNQNYSMAAPPSVVNANGYASNGLLFIKSPLLSSNETEEILEKANIIDVYDLSNGSYRFSFYIPKFGGRGFRDIKIYGNLLVVLYDKRIETFVLSSKYF